MHPSALQRMAGFRDRYLDPNKPLHIVDLGACSGQQGVCHRPLFDRAQWRYEGVDIVAGPNVDTVISDPYNWVELEDGSVDVLISGQVFEHIEYMWLTMLEVRRVLKPGGLLCVIVPSSGRIHRAPVDCWRFYPDGLRALAHFGHLEPLLAAIEWQPEGQTIAENHWHDAILVAQKPKISGLVELRSKEAHLALLRLRDAQGSQAQKGTRKSPLRRDLETAKHAVDELSLVYRRMFRRSVRKGTKAARTFLKRTISDAP